LFEKPLLRALRVPCIVSIAAIALGSVVGITAKADPSTPAAVYASGADLTATALTPVVDQPAPAERNSADADKQRLQLKPPEEPAKQEPTTTEPAPSQDAPAAEEAPATPEPTPVPPSLFENSQIVTFYGTPLAPGMGVLGTFPPDEMAQRLKGQAQIYDDLNGDRGVIGAMDLIYGVVQSEPTNNGLYVSYLDDARVEEYIRLADQYDLQLILDLQIGRSTVADEIKKVERFLLNPRVHVAIDPEYAVGPNGYPIHTPGVISGHDINGAQLYLSELAAANNLRPKMLVIHQFRDGTIIEGEVTAELPNVDLVLNMDAFGPYADKVNKYKHYASRPYAHHRSFNIFLKQDEPVGSEQDVLALDPMPDMVMYQ
jgi:hypothetical protein